MVCKPSPVFGCKMKHNKSSRAKVHFLPAAVVAGGSSLWIKEMQPSFFPPWVQTMYRLKSGVILRWLVRRASVWRQREEEDSCEAVSRSAVWVMIEVQLLFKPTGTLETQGWQLQAKTVHVGESTEIIVGITIHLHKHTILFFSFFLLCGKLDMGVFKHANVHFLPQTYPIFQKSNEKIERISFSLLFFSITPTSQSTTDTHGDWSVPQNYSCFWKLIKKQNNKALGLGCDMLAITGKCCLLNSAKFKVSKLEKNEEET